MTDAHGGFGPLDPDEFLAFEEASPLRHEYVAGRVYTMVGTTARHNAIVRNIVLRLTAGAKGGPCGVYFLDLKVRAARDHIYYPDCVVVCTPHDGETLIFDEPCLIVEVTSRGTRRIDRGEKLDAYLAIPSLRAYLVVEQDRSHVTCYTRAGSEWIRDEIMTSGSINIPCPAVTLSLDDIYDDIALPPPRVREDDADEAWVDELEPR